MSGKKIKTCLWFDDNAEEAIALYTSLFKDSGVVGVTPGPDGSALAVEFRLAGVDFIAINGGPIFRFTEAISLSVDCETQAELDELWTKLTEGGEESQCGWLKDRYGLSWQLVPTVISQALASPDRGRAGRIMDALMGMKKINIAVLLAAGDEA